MLQNFPIPDFNEDFITAVSYISYVFNVEVCQK